MNKKFKNITNLYIVRHGEFDNPKKVFYERELDFPLNQTGRKNIRCLGVLLKKRGVNPKIIYASPLKRTMESAKILSKVFKGVKIQKDQRLLERWSRGIAGRPQLLEKKWRDTYRNVKKDYKVETPFHQAERIHCVIRSILKKWTGCDVILVSHGDPLAFAIYHALHPKRKLPSIRYFLKNLYLKKSQSIHMALDERGKVLEAKLLTKQEPISKIASSPFG